MLLAFQRLIAMVSICKILAELFLEDINTCFTATSEWCQSLFKDICGRICNDKVTMDGGIDNFLQINQR